MAAPRNLGVVAFACILVVFFLPSGCLGVTLDGWIVRPTGIAFFYDERGPDGIPGTADDLPPGGIGISSGYVGGEYINRFGERVTAHVSLTSTVWPIGGDWWQYHWEITNLGTGDFVEFYCTPGGPNFLQNPPLSPGESEIDGRVGGRPIIGLWGGRWNPDVGLEVQDYRPIPEPATLFLFGTGLGAVLGFARRRHKM